MYGNGGAVGFAYAGNANDGMGGSGQR
jgi:hypothetical protein